jgi:hypothetical protein
MSSTPTKRPAVQGVPARSKPRTTRTLRAIVRDIELHQFQDLERELEPRGR